MANLTISRRQTPEPIVTKFETRLRRGHLPPRKIRVQSAQGFLPPYARNTRPET